MCYLCDFDPWGEASPFAPPTAHLARAVLRAEAAEGHASSVALGPVPRAQASAAGTADTLNAPGGSPMDPRDKPEDDGVIVGGAR